MITGLEDMIGINKDTGEFDINLVPESIRADVISMTKSMIKNKDLTTKKKKGCNRKRKPRVKRLKKHKT